MTADNSGYAEWVRWLEAFRRGEDPPTEGLGPIEGRLGSYVEARVLDRLSVAFADRVRQWQTALGDRIVARPPEGPEDAARTLRDAVERLAPLTRLASSPMVPRSVGASMTAVLGEVRDGARSALDEAWRRRAEEVAEVEVPQARVAGEVARARAAGLDAHDVVGVRHRARTTRVT